MIMLKFAGRLVLFTGGIIAAVVLQALVSSF
jgi:hypothetical protein